MKKNIFIFIFLLNFCAPVMAQYDYQSGNLLINGVTLKVGGTNLSFFVENINNVLGNIVITHPVIDCGEAHFTKRSWGKIKGVFQQVFRPARRLAFSGKRWIGIFITANPQGAILEIAFEFPRGSMVTPQELYELEIGLKALTGLEYSFPADCTGVNYRATNNTFYIDEL
jgi:hypothetical protein